MNKHTPGPWTYWSDASYGDTRFYITQSNEAPYTVAYSDVATLIAETVSGEKKVIQEANARLIAAAPELLDALRSARQELAGLPHSLGYDFTHIPKIDTAISKATGESK